MNSPARANQAAAALLLTLALLVLISVVVVGLMQTIQMDRTASSSHFSKSEAAQFSQMGVEKVTATLRKETTDPKRVWISQPGQLVVNPDRNKSPSWSNVRLYSWDVNQPGLPTVNLNVPTVTDPNNGLIADRSVGVNVQWIYVGEDGQETSDPSTATSPIVGRYAYWTDDESSKINYNLAWKRGGSSSPNTDPPGHPTTIDLTALPAVSIGLTYLPESIANALHSQVTTDSYKTTASFYNSPEDARRVETKLPGISSVLAENRFSLTHFNHDPDTTFFNEPRIVLTTLPWRAGWTYDKSIARWVGTNGEPGAKGTPPYLRILSYANEGTSLANDPSQPAGNAVDSGFDAHRRVDPAAMQETVDLLNSYLSATTWPMAWGSSFQAKYYAGKPARLTQLSINIIEYVRSRESAAQIVRPIRGFLKYQLDPSLPPYFYLEKATDPASTTVDAFIGITRSPRITEMGFWADSTFTLKKFKVELHLPQGFNIKNGVDVTKLRIWLSLNGNSNGCPSDAAILASEVSINGNPPTSTALLPPGGYAVITKTITPPISSRPTSVKPRCAISANPDVSGTDLRRLDIAPLGAPLDSAAAFTVVNCPVNDPAVTEANMPSVEVDDPRVNSHGANWISRNVNSFGRQNNECSLGKLPSAKLSAYIPPIDTEPEIPGDPTSKSVVSGASFFMPPPAGTFGGPNVEKDGFVLAAAELGYIHTGMESTALEGIPWRTLRLQPDTKSSAGTVPDWAFMDLFTVPIVVNSAARPVFSPHNTTFGGRVNLNAVTDPSVGVNRIYPLTAVFKGAKRNVTGGSLSRSDAETIAKAVFQQDWSIPTRKYGYSKGFDSPGEIVEIKGVADLGEPSEELIRQIGNLTTARGSVFTVYTVGQAIRMVNGKPVVRAEHRRQCMLERFPQTTDYKGTPNDKTDDKTEIRIRPIYFRDLTP